MKFSIYCLLCLVQIIFASQEWSDFKTKFQKTYKNVAEENFRKEIFLKNLQLIEEHNKKYEQGLKTYTLGVTYFADLSREERFQFHEKRTQSVPKIEKIESKVRYVQVSDEDVPDSIDWRDYGVITPVTDQTWCNACWAHAVVATVEGHMGIHRGIKNVSLSQQNLEECAVPGFVCMEQMNDFLIDQAYQYIVDNQGMDTYESYPYTEAINPCHFTVEGLGASIVDYAAIPEGDEEEMKRVVGTLGPVTVAITTDIEWDLYTGGVFYEEDWADNYVTLNHAVAVVGYGTEDGQDYWLAKNEWGPYFGLDGYIKLARNRDNNCGIASIARYPVM